MAITVKNVTDMFGKDVFTLKGQYCGRISNMKMDLAKFRIQSLMLEIARGSFLSSLIGSKKGIIVPYNFVESIGDVVIIKNISPTTMPEEATDEVEPMSGFP